MDGLERRLRNLGAVTPPLITPRQWPTVTLVDASTVVSPSLNGFRQTAGLQQQVVATAGDITVVVDLGGDDADITIRGQIIGEDLASVQLLDGVGYEIALTMTDESGEFELPHVDISDAVMVICCGSTEVYVPLRRA